MLGYGSLGSLTNVLFVPEVDALIVLSVGQLTRSNCAITFNKNEVSVLNAKGEEINKGIKNDENLYEVSAYEGSRKAWKYVTPSFVPKHSEGRLAECLMIKMIDYMKNKIIPTNRQLCLK